MNPCFGELDIAIIGMAGRFPSSPTLHEFWTNIVESRNCIERSNAGTAAFGRLAGIRCFDADFFDIPRAEALLLDPQHRIVLELVWHALEDAGLAAAPSEEIVSVYLGCAPSSYMPLLAAPQSLRERYQMLVSNLPDFVAARVSHRFDFRGESLLVATGCSSSLVAVHFGCQSLLRGQSTVAVVGGVSVLSDAALLAAAEDGMIIAADGVCRPFDAAACGSVPGNGAGLVILKRAQAAWDDGDRIRAIIKASAINNDGSDKSGFMGPSARGQAEVIATALALAEVPPESIRFIETHGTATRIGDPVEVEGLKRAFADCASGAARCALGALKANFGHLDRAAGVAGVIKGARSTSSARRAIATHLSN